MFKILQFIKHNIPLLNPLMHFNSLGNIQRINELKREVPIIISISANENNFNETAMTLYSIFNQTISPDRVVLWICNEFELSELPYSITKYVKNGLEIRFIEELGTYTNIIYALKEFEKSIVVTAENNIYYGKDWLKKLYHSYISNPNYIHIHSAHQIEINKDKILPYNNWEKYVNQEIASYKYFPITYGGVLYPPECFVKEIFREDIYKKILNTSWDVWSWAIAVVSGRKFMLVKNHDDKLYCVNILKQIIREIDNCKNSNKKDEQLNQLLKFYKNNIFSKLDLN